MAARASTKLMTDTCVSAVNISQVITVSTPIAAAPATLVKMAEHVITDNGLTKDMQGVSALTATSETSASMTSASVTVDIIHADMASVLNPPSGTIVRVITLN